MPSALKRHKFNVDLEIGKYTVDEKYLNMSQAFNSQVLKLAEFCLVKVSRFQLPRQTRACPNVMIALVVNMQRKALMMVAGRGKQQQKIQKHHLLSNLVQ